MRTVRVAHCSNNQQQTHIRWTHAEANDDDAQQSDRLAVQRDQRSGEKKEEKQDAQSARSAHDSMTDTAAPSRKASLSKHPDALRFIHLDVAGGSQNFGSCTRGGTDSASGGKGGTPAAKIKHVLACQAAGRTLANARDPTHTLCMNCNPQNKPFVNNYISTTKYGLLKFLPLNLYEQFQKKANAYFLLVAIISLTPLSPKTPVVSVAPLLLVLMVSAIKEAIEDFQRYQMDKKINASFVDVWRSDGSLGDSSTPGGPNVPGSGFEPVAWADLTVGDVVFVREGGAFPADIILLQSSADQGVANIETANLDGETNLKVKQAVPECWRIMVSDGGGDGGAAAAARAPFVTAASSRKLHASSGEYGALQRVGSRRTLSSSNGDEGLSSRSNPKSRSETDGLKWPLKLPPLIIESSPPSKKLDGSAWKANMTFLAAPRGGGGSGEGEGGDQPAAGQQQKMALGMQQLLLRGCILRNTKWIVGLVMFTGTETKLMLNNRAASFKRSHVDRIVDQSLYILFAFEFALCTFGAVANYLWMSAHKNKLWWLPDVSELGVEAALSWFTYLVLLDILIPISLYVSMELVKAVQAALISSDKEMYHAETNTPAHARTSNLNEELGQVHHIFTDKTGTLTCNIMNFVACSVDGKEYGLDALKVGGGAGGAAGGGGTSDAAAGASSSSVSTDPEHLEAYSVPSLNGLPPRDADFPFKDTSLVRALLSGPGSSARGGHGNGGGTADVKLIDQYLTLLSTCHTVLPDFPGCHREHVHTLGENCKFAVQYQAASPDEKALTIAAKNQGYYFFHREPVVIPLGGQSFNGERVLVNILGHVHAFLILDSFEFSSERARMSVVLLDPRDGLIKVYTKGADTKMYKLLSAESKGRSWAATEKSLKSFSQFGLRTLICGYKTLTESEYLAWAGEYSKAKSSIDRREELVAHWQNVVEQNLTLVGSTAIEDRLQDGVPWAISKLSEAGIKIWVLTGDKVETAINIARSCSLVTPKMDATGLLELVIDDKLSDEEALKSTQAQLASALKRVEEVAGHLPAGEASDSLAIIVSGQALSHIFTVVRDEKGREILYENLSDAQRTAADVLRDQFLAVCSRCSAVVCCRVSPNQKAEVVSLVKAKRADLVTLAIGDGANDVSMIKAAHVGIGISGLEGLQAVMASDYSIAQFRFLVPLLLCHGAWSYCRTSKLILYCFYKNCAIALTSIWFALQSGYSAQLFYDAYCGSVYNIIFTSIPVMLVAVLDRDVSRESLIKYPALYQSGLRNECFNVRLLLRIIGEGLAHSLLLYFCCVALYTGGGDVVLSEGQTHDMWVLSTAMYSYLIIVVTARIALDTSTFTWLNAFFLIGSVVVWFLFALGYCYANVTPDMLMVAQVMMGTPAFWLGLGVIPAMCIVPEVAWMAYRRTYMPTLKDVVQEIERGYGKEQGKDLSSLRAATRVDRGLKQPANHDVDVVIVRAHAAPTTLVHLSPRHSASISALISPPNAAHTTSSGLGAEQESALVRTASRNGLFPPPALTVQLQGTPSPHASPKLTARASSLRRVSASQEHQALLNAASAAHEQQSSPPPSARRNSRLFPGGGLGHSSPMPTGHPSPSGASPLPLHHGPHPHERKTRASVSAAPVTSTR